MARQYVVRADGNVISTAISILVLTAPSTSAVELVRATLSQTGITVSTQGVIEVIRKTAAATGTSVTPVAVNENDAAAASTALDVITGEGTNGNVILKEAFNFLNGWTWIPTPDERIGVKASGIIALTFPVAPTSATWYAEMVFEELV